MKLCMPACASVASWRNASERYTIDVQTCSSPRRASSSATTARRGAAAAREALWRPGGEGGRGGGGRGRRAPGGPRGEPLRLLDEAADGVGERGGIGERHDLAGAGGEGGLRGRESARLNSSPPDISPLSPHAALPI